MLLHLRSQYNNHRKDGTLLDHELQQRELSQDRSHYFLAFQLILQGYPPPIQFAKQLAQALIHKLMVLYLDN